MEREREGKGERDIGGGGERAGQVSSSIQICIVQLTGIKQYI